RPTAGRGALRPAARVRARGPGVRRPRRRLAMTPIRNGISVDLEDWFSLVRRRLWGVEEPPTERVVIATRRLLELLDSGRTRATFFVLGSVADAFPDLV